MSISLPTPTGPYPVSFIDILDKTGKDGTFFRIYYPTTTFDATKVTFPIWMEQEYFKHFSVYMKGITLFPLSVPINLPLSMPQKMEKLPVILFSHGLLLTKDAYSFVCSDLASYGYLVAAIDHKDGSASGSFYMEKSTESEGQLIKKVFQDNFIPFGTEGEFERRLKQVEIRVQEITKVLDLLEMLNQGKLSNIFDPKSDLSQFEGKLMIDKAVVMGHSHGGATALVSLIKDERFKCALAYDPWMLVVDEEYLKVKVEKPIFIINCINNIKKEDVLKMRQLDGDVTGTTAERLIVTLLGTSHFTQSDLGFFPETFLKTITLMAKYDPNLSNTINTELTLSFLGKYFGISGNKDVSSIVNQYKEYVKIGTDIDVSDAEILEAKKKVRSMV